MSSLVWIYENMRPNFDRFFKEQEVKLSDIVMDQTETLKVYWKDGNDRYLTEFTEFANGCAYLICHVNSSLDQADFIQNLREFVGKGFNYTKLLATETDEYKINKFLELGWKEVEVIKNRRTQSVIHLFEYDLYKE